MWVSNKFGLNISPKLSKAVFKYSVTTLHLNAIEQKVLNITKTQYLKRGYKSATSFIP